MSTQAINIEETIFCNAVRAVISELRCANRFLTGDAVIELPNVSVHDVVSSVLTRANSISSGFYSVFDSRHYRIRFSAIQQVVSNLTFAGFCSLTAQKIQSVINALELYLKPVEIPVFKQVELFDLVNSDINNKSRKDRDIKYRDMLAYVLIDSVPFRSLTKKKLDKLGFVFCKDIFRLSRSDFYVFHNQLSKRDVQDIFDTLSVYGIRFD